ncbi:hypothetical protein LZ30DRAFT_462138 [Colletotrichum cereale]|nr:hypothetical protein LZ30DRAFT_462138 [Colletotrichum cereale]
MTLPSHLRISHSATHGRQSKHLPLPCSRTWGCTRGGAFGDSRLKVFGACGVCGVGQRRLAMGHHSRCTSSISYHVSEYPAYAGEVTSARSALRVTSGSPHERGRLSVDDTRRRIQCRPWSHLPRPMPTLLRGGGIDLSWESIKKQHVRSGAGTHSHPSLSAATMRAPGSGISRPPEGGYIAERTLWRIRLLIHRPFVVRNRAIVHPRRDDGELIAGFQWPG